MGKKISVTENKGNRILTSNNNPLLSRYDSITKYFNKKFILAKPETDTKDWENYNKIIWFIDDDINDPRKLENDRKKQVIQEYNIFKKNLESKLKNYRKDEEHEYVIEWVEKTIENMGEADFWEVGNKYVITEWGLKKGDPIEPRIKERANEFPVDNSGNKNSEDEEIDGKKPEDKKNENENVEIKEEPYKKAEEFNDDPLNHTKDEYQEEKEKVHDKESFFKKNWWKLLIIFISFFILLLILNSCDGKMYLSGRITDIETGEKIDSAQINYLDTKYGKKCYSNDLGFYKMNFRTKDGKKIPVTYNKQKYKIKSINLKENKKFLSIIFPKKVTKNISLISDKEEMNNGTNPNKADMAGDGLSDKGGMNKDIDPNKDDKDGNGLSDKEKMNNGTNPNKDDKDGNGLSDKEKMNNGNGHKKQEPAIPPITKKSLKKMPPNNQLELIYQVFRVTEPTGNIYFIMVDKETGEIKEVKSIESRPGKDNYERKKSYM